MTSFYFPKRRKKKAIGESVRFEIEWKPEHGDYLKRMPREDPLWSPFVAEQFLRAAEALV